MFCASSSAGAMMGNVVTLPVAGILCQNGFSEGWDSVFYVIGQCLSIYFSVYRETHYNCSWKWPTNIN